MKIKSFEAEGGLGLDSFVNFNHKPILPITNALEKKLDRIAKKEGLYIDGMLSVFQKQGALAKILSKREKIEATVSESEQAFFKVNAESLIKEAYAKLEKFAKENKLIITLRLHCWRI